MRNSRLVIILTCLLFMMGATQQSEAQTTQPVSLTYERVIEVGVFVEQGGASFLVNGLFKLKITAMVNSFGFQSIQSFSVTKLWAPEINIDDKQLWIDSSSNNGILSWAIWLSSGTEPVNHELALGNITLLEFVNNANEGPGINPPML